jgi:hypothetical protein
MVRSAVVLVAVALCLQTQAQQKTADIQMTKAAAAVCYASGKNEFTTIGPSAEYLAYKARKGSARIQTANIEVDYEGFTADAQAAFQEAVDIWESILRTPIKIRIHARWTALATGVLGSASPGTYVYDFDGAPMKGVWYPIALAEKIAGKELNDPSEYDIEAAFNSAQTSWHFGLTGSNPPEGKYDLVSIVLHEIAHGLGITHAYDVVGGQAVIPSYFNGKPVVYETGIRSANGFNYVYAFTPPSTQLKSAITSKALYFSSPLVSHVNFNSDAVLYAPTTYVGGSSIAHLDEFSYPAGTTNSLMTPAIGAAERILDPGPIVLAILKEMGWSFTNLEHTPIKNTEDTNGPYHVVVKVKSDAGYNPNNVKLTYSAGNPAPATVTMTPTGNPDEYAFDLAGAVTEYDYSISVIDNDTKTFTIPATYIEPGRTPLFNPFRFTAGPDTFAPVISHIEKQFVTNIDDFAIDAIVADNIGVASVILQWQINGNPQPAMPMTLETGSQTVYETVLSKNNFQIGDTIEYRFRAMDTSVAGNVAYNPSAAGFYMAVVTGFGETKDSYSNDFDDLSTADFFGSGFMILGDQNLNGHIQSMPTPYPAGGAVGAHVDLTYNLKYPIRVAARGATVKFDEIVLVEPGENGAVWPSEDFYDYVVVEGSADGGITWVAIADGYDCNYDNAWKDLWNSTFNGENSTGVPTPGLYRSHVFNLLNKFHAGDEVALRFRLYSDPFATGWGWSIDNMKIQIDETPPAIRHQHYDFVIDTVRSIALNMKITDDGGVRQIFVDLKANNGSVTTQEILVNPALDKYFSKIDLTSLAVKAGDVVQYKIRAIDSVGNIGSFPPGDFIKMTLISLTSSMNEAHQSDFTGNFFNVGTTGADTNHPYDVGMGIDGNSEFTLVTKKPIKVSATNSRIYYTDIALVEYNGNDVKDYVVVEASKDGSAWQQLISPYAANSVADWKSMYDVDGVPTAQTRLQQHQFDITAGGNFKAGDVILVRFRLHSDSLKTGWGWALHDVSIQGEVTGLEPPIANEIVRAWPNPVVDGALYLKLALPAASGVNVEILDMHGQLISSDQFSAPAGDFEREYDVSAWSSGLYLIKVRSDFGTSGAKLIKLK